MTEATNSPAVSVIVPLFNEEENMSLLQSELRAALGGLDHEIVFVDDGSVDRTVERIKPAPNIRVIRFEKNRGQSAAIYAGLRAPVAPPQFSSMAICKMIPWIFPGLSLRSHAAPISSVAIDCNARTHW